MTAEPYKRVRLVVGAEFEALAAVFDGSDDDARDALAGLLPDELTALATAATRLADIAGCMSRAVR